MEQMIKADTELAERDPDAYMAVRGEWLRRKGGEFFSPEEAREICRS